MFCLYLLTVVAGKRLIGICLRLKINGSLPSIVANNSMKISKYLGAVYNLIRVIIIRHRWLFTSPFGVFHPPTPKIYTSKSVVLYCIPYSTVYHILFCLLKPKFIVTAIIIIRTFKYDGDKNPPPKIVKTPAFLCENDVAGKNGKHSLDIHDPTKQMGEPG